MIDDLNETIRNLLIEELAIGNGEIAISFDQPNTEWSGKVSGPTINLFLYDVRENSTLRQHHWERITNGNGHSDRPSRKRMPLRIDCSYMLTTWVKDHPDDEHRLLSLCMLALFKHPVLPEDRLVGTLRNPPFEIQTSLARHDKLTNPAEVWSALENQMRPTIPYIVTISLDPWEEISGEPVRTLTWRVRQTHDLPRRWQAQPEAERSDKHVIGGTVRDQAQDGAPAAGVEVAIKGTGLFTTTNEQGRFVLGSLPANDYTLVVWPSDGRPTEKAITVPASAKQDYDVNL